MNSISLFIKCFSRQRNHLITKRSFNSINATSDKQIFDKSSQNKTIHHIINRCLNFSPEQKGLLSEEDTHYFTKLKRDNFEVLNVYSRLLKKCNKISADFFISFKPYADHTEIQSPIIKSLDLQNFPKMGYGLGFDQKGIRKIWCAPYGNQLEFIQALSSNYVPFIDMPGNPEIPHYIGYFPESDQHQIYYYLGKHSEKVDPKLAVLNPDYFGISYTYNRNWQVIKENQYAIRVPIGNYKNDECFEIPDVKYINVSNRKTKTANNLDEVAVSYLCGRF